MATNTPQGHPFAGVTPKLPCPRRRGRPTTARLTRAAIQRHDCGAHSSTVTGRAQHGASQHGCRRPELTMNALPALLSCMFVCMSLRQT